MVEVDIPIEDGDEDGGRYRIRLENVFEGPMDLLIHLIRKAEVDIYDIPISQITDAYLSYLSWMKQMNIDVAGDFVLMASILTHIKSRMLLPPREDETPEEDPRLEITRPLLEYLRIKSAAETLSGRSLLGEAIFIRKSNMDDDAFQNGEVDDARLCVSLVDLMDAFQRILDRDVPGHRVDLQKDRLSVQDRIRQLTEILEITPTLSFDALFSGPLTRSDIIVTFLALLEMAKIGLIYITQETSLGPMSITYQ
ncbi:segregation/condensation protein A [Desulfosarcina sp. OttesenSCG-928-A07]|nr:segregation/condensation protein A [Desulfosarcina sp. OttesenSCG-928-G17]MDL2329573.1 segregation/condensation protein A [Desulfosarcina sp. OttesenSCG-928-A07]